MLGIRLATLAPRPLRTAQVGPARSANVARVDPRSRPGKSDGESARPILFVDVDGVISLFDFPDEARPPGRGHPVGGMEHYISEASGGHLRELAERFELVWATGWEHNAERHLPELLGLPSGRMHTLTFDGRIAGGPAHWKIDAIERYAQGRPAAWIDDNIDNAVCRRWAEERPAPTLLVPTEPATGIAEDHVGRLLEWADEVRHGLAPAEETVEPEPSAAEGHRGG